MCAQLRATGPLLLPTSPASPSRCPRAQFQAALKRPSITLTNRQGAGGGASCVVRLTSVALLGFTAENLPVSLGDSEGSKSSIR